jgi:hypothetical protein
VCSDPLLAADAAPEAGIAAVAANYDHKLNRIFHSTAPAANQQEKLAPWLSSWNRERRTRQLPEVLLTKARVRQERIRTK